MKRAALAPLLLLASLLASTLAGWEALSMPLNGDTALFQSGALHLLDGRTLYVDWWDLKGPGVYLVHAVAIALFGAGAFGLHLFELGSLLTVSVLLATTSRRALGHRWIAALMPVFTVGAYYLVAQRWHLSQPAVFAGAALALAWAGLASARPVAALFAGAALVLAVCLKLSALAPAIALLAYAGWLPRAADRPAGVVSHPASAAVLGMLLAGAGVAALLAAQGALGAFWWTMTAWRDAADLVAPGVGLERFAGSLRWFAGRHVALLALALVACVHAWGPARGDRAGWPWRAAGLWLLVGLPAIALERFAAWPFDLVLLTFPVGLLAVRGLDLSLSAAARQWRLSGTAATALVLAAVVIALAPALHALTLRAGDRQGGEALARQVAATAAHLQDQPAGEIYVFGNPLHLLAGNRRMATSLNGWAWELQPAFMWERFGRELRAHPPQWLLLTDPYADLVRARHPPTWGWITEAYRPAARIGNDQWMELRAPPAR
ncbi:MAG: hypothetical protein R3E68_07320 [Burkholderiaceae bacterium]